MHGSWVLSDLVTFVTSIAPLDVEERLKLQNELFTSNRNYIVQYLNPDEVIGDLISKHLIGQSAGQQLSNPMKTTKEKNKIIVDELCKGGRNTFGKFCEVLRDNRKTKFMADKLETG